MEDAPAASGHKVHLTVPGCSSCLRSPSTSDSARLLAPYSWGTRWSERHIVLTSVQIYFRRIRIMLPDPDPKFSPPYPDSDPILISFEK